MASVVLGIETDCRHVDRRRGEAHVSSLPRPSL